MSKLLTQQEYDKLVEAKTHLVALFNFVKSTDADAYLESQDQDWWEGLLAYITDETDYYD